MKSTLIMLVLAIMAAMSPLSAAAEPPAADAAAAKKDVLVRHQEWETAAVKGQGAAYFEKHSAPDYVYTSADGVVSDKQACLAALNEAVIESWKIDDVQVRLYGDSTLVATGRAVIKGTVKGKNVLDRLRFTETVVKRDGQWQPVALQFTRIATP